MCTLFICWSLEVFDRKDFSQNWQVNSIGFWSWHGNGLTPLGPSFWFGGGSGSASDLAISLCLAGGSGGEIASFSLMGSLEGEQSCSICKCILSTSRSKKGGRLQKGHLIGVFAAGPFSSWTEGGSVLESGEGDAKVIFFLVLGRSIIGVYSWRILGFFSTTGG